MGLRKNCFYLIFPTLLSSCASMPQKQPSPCGTWIELVNQQDEIATVETAGRWELIRQCVELSQYFRLSEKAGEWLINKQVGHVEATDLEREYIAFRVAYFYIQALQSHDPKVRRQELIEGANVAWRRIARMPHVHAFAELSLIRLRELCGEIGYDVEYPVAVPVPPGMGRWAFVRPSQGVVEVGDFSKPYGETVFARRPQSFSSRRQLLASSRCSFGAPSSFPITWRSKRFCIPLLCLCSTGLADLSPCRTCNGSFIETTGHSEHSTEGDDA